ncbi:MAG: hypothetical protein QME68_02160 [Elusimicrobiota bacterium]|nr:hypothetical protein [Elusimicrobiota bacterium]
MQSATTWWLNNICNKRVHGVTKKVPDEVFEKEEKQLLLPLPSVDYSISVWSRRTVSNICHICYENNYYSVPYEYVHKEVIVEDTGKLVRVYYANNVVAVHTKLSGKGSFQTNNSHYPSYKISTTEYQQNYKVKMQHIGAYACKYFEAKEFQYFLCFPEG